MGMRLLKKSEVLALKQEEQKATVEQGIQLAKKVDRLREVAAAEEASLLLFRDKTVKAIHEEIQKEQYTLDTLTTQVRKIRNEIAAGTKEADKYLAEAKKIRTAAFKFKEKLDAKLEVIRKRAKIQEAARVRTSTLTKKLKRLVAEHEAKIAMLDKRENTIREVQLQMAREREELEKMKNAAGHELMTREAELLARERNIAMVEARQVKRDTELDNRERAIADKYATLQQTIKLTKK